MWIHDKSLSVRHPCWSPKGPPGTARNAGPEGSPPNRGVIEKKTEYVPVDRETFSLLLRLVGMMTMTMMKMVVVAVVRDHQTLWELGQLPDDEWTSTEAQKGVRRQG